MSSRLDSGVPNASDTRMNRVWRRQDQHIASRDPQRCNTGLQSPSERDLLVSTKQARTAHGRWCGRDGQDRRDPLPVRRCAAVVPLPALRGAAGATALRRRVMGVPGLSRSPVQESAAASSGPSAGPGISRPSLMSCGKRAISSWAIRGRDGPKHMKLYRDLPAVYAVAG